VYLRKTWKVVEKLKGSVVMVVEAAFEVVVEVYFTIVVLQ